MSSHAIAGLNSWRQIDLLLFEYALHLPASCRSTSLPLLAWLNVDQMPQNNLSMGSFAFDLFATPLVLQ